MSKLVRLPEDSFDKLNELVKDTGASKQVLLAKAVDRLFRENFIAKANKACEALKRDEKQWREMLEERALWEAAGVDIKDN